MNNLSTISVQKFCNIALYRPYEFDATDFCLTKQQEKAFAIQQEGIHLAHFIEEQGKTIWIAIKALYEALVNPYTNIVILYNNLQLDFHKTIKDTIHNIILSSPALYQSLRSTRCLNKNDIEYAFLNGSNIEILHYKDYKNNNNIIGRHYHIFLFDDTKYLTKYNLYPIVPMFFTYDSKREPHIWFVSKEDNPLERIGVSFDYKEHTLNH